jgi:hypothetical protein
MHGASTRGTSGRTANPETKSLIARVDWHGRDGSTGK